MHTKTLPPEHYNKEIGLSRTESKVNEYSNQTLVSSSTAGYRGLHKECIIYFCLEDELGKIHILRIIFIYAYIYVIYYIYYIYNT